MYLTAHHSRIKRKYASVTIEAMGSPVSVVVANIVMEHIEDLALSMYVTGPYRILEEICG